MDTCNTDCNSLERMVQKTIAEGKVSLGAIVAVDLFGWPADDERIRSIAEKYRPLIFERAGDSKCRVLSEVHEQAAGLSEYDL